MSVQVADWTKLIVVILVGAAAFVLGYTHVLDAQAVIALLSADLGYVFGNSHGVMSAAAALQAAQSQPQPPQQPPANGGA